MPNPRTLPLLPIDKNVPITAKPKGNVSSQRFRLDLARLEVGDSVFIPDATRPPVHEMHQVGFLWNYKWTYRTYGEHGPDPHAGKLGVRLWRVA